MILFLFKPSISETYMTLSDRAITFILLMKQIFLIIKILKLDRSLSVSEDSNVWTVSVRFAPTRPSVENRKNQQIRSHIHECI